MGMVLRLGPKSKMNLRPERTPRNENGNEWKWTRTRADGHRHIHGRKIWFLFSLHFLYGILIGRYQAGVAWKWGETESLHKIQKWNRPWDIYFRRLFLVRCAVLLLRFFFI